MMHNHEEDNMYSIDIIDDPVFDATDDDFVRARLTLLDKDGKEVKVAEEVFEGMLDRP